MRSATLSGRALCVPALHGNGLEARVAQPNLSAGRLTYPALRVATGGLATGNLGRAGDAYPAGHAGRLPASVVCPAKRTDQDKEKEPEPSKRAHRADPVDYGWHLQETSSRTREWLEIYVWAHEEGVKLHYYPTTGTARAFFNLRDGAWADKDRETWRGLTERQFKNLLLNPHAGPGFA
ncbi:hypothetical protein ABPG75_000082 [Micractinium tetrahymenae]